MTDHLAAHLRGAAVGQGDRLDTAAHARARLQHDHVGAARDQVTRCCQSRQSGSQDGHVGHVSPLGPV